MRRVVLLLLAGCGRIGFDAGAVADAPEVDAAPLGPWTTGTSIPGADIAGSNEQDVTGTTSKLELFYTIGGADVDIYTMTRASVGDPWGPSQRWPLSTVGFAEGGARLSFDDLTIYFDSQRPGGLGNFDVWIATRTAPGQPWSTPTPFTEVNSAMTDKWFSPCRDGRYVMVRDVGDDEIFEGKLGVTPPTIVPILNSPQNDTAAFLTEDCMTLFFSSQRNASHDIMTAQRQLDGTWGAPRVFTEICNNVRDELDPWMSPDGRLFLFAADQLDGTGSKDIHQIVR